MIRYLRPFVDKGKNFRFHRVSTFLRELSVETGGSPWVQLPKLLWCMYRGFNYHDFLYFHLHRLSYRVIQTYHSTFDNVRFVERLNSSEALPLLRDKGLFLKRFTRYLGRDHLDLRDSNLSEFLKFIDAHSCLVAKAYNLARGTGVEVIDTLPPPSPIVQPCIDVLSPKRSLSWRSLSLSTLR